ncbi:hypothetical protein AB6D11_02870 [Vibrio splendidus]
MWFISDILKQSKKEIGGSLSELHKSAKGAKLKLEDVRQDFDGEPAVSPEVTPSQFTARYKNLRLVHLLSFIGLIVAVTLTSKATNIPAFAMGSSVSMYMFIYSLSVSYKGWRARLVAGNWDARDKPLRTTFSQFIASTLNKPSNLMPLPLKYKKMRL